MFLTLCLTVYYITHVFIYKALLECHQYQISNRINIDRISKYRTVHIPASWYRVTANKFGVSRARKSIQFIVVDHGN